MEKLKEALKTDAAVLVERQAHTLKGTAASISAFKTGCEEYLVKPIDKKKLVEEIRKLGLIKGVSP